MLMKHERLKQLVKESCGLGLSLDGLEKKNLRVLEIIKEGTRCEDSDFDYFDQITKILIEFERKSFNLTERLDRLDLEKGKILELMKNIDKSEKSSRFVIGKINFDETRTCKIYLQGKEIQENQTQELDFSQSLSLKFEVSHRGLRESTAEISLEAFISSKIFDLEKAKMNFQIDIAGLDSKFKIKSEIKLSPSHKLQIINHKLEEIDKTYLNLKKNFAIFNEILDFCSIQYNNETKTFFSSDSKSQNDRKSCCEECQVF